MSPVQIQLQPPQRPVGQAAKTPPFHGGDMSSILVRVTKPNPLSVRGDFLFSVYRRAETASAPRRTRLLQEVVYTITMMSNLRGERLITYPRIKLYHRILNLSREIYEICELFVFSASSLLKMTEIGPIFCAAVISKNPKCLLTYRGVRAKIIEKIPKRQGDIQ